MSKPAEYNAAGQGMKLDQGKVQWDLVPFATLEGMARVLMFGAAKYDKHQWRNGMPHTQPFEALLRHLFAWQAGEDIDSDSLLPHLDHALCELMFLRYFVQNFPEMDNRFKAAKR